MPKERYKKFNELSRVQKYRRIKALIENGNKNSRSGDIIAEQSSSSLGCISSSSTDTSSQNEVLDDVRSTRDPVAILERSPPNSPNTKNHEGDAPCVLSLHSRLGRWVLDNSIARNAVTELLHILNETDPNDLHNLPLDVRTLMGTPKTLISTKKVGDFGEYVHFGLESGIRKHWDKHRDGALRNIKVCCVFIHFDGVSLSKSTSSTLWPISCSLAEVYVDPFIVGAYHGTKEPNNITQFLEEFVREARNLVTGGIVINGVKMPFSIKGYVCDAPARALIKAVKGHTGYFSCEKCEVEGEYGEKRMFFRDLTARKRTDERFASGAYNEDHCKGISPLLSIPGIKMVTQFPLEYMHLVCLGVVKRLLKLLTSGPLKVRLQASITRAVSLRLLEMSQMIPCEFARKSRSLSELPRWKATELRLFLLYLGPVAFRGLLPADLFNNFLVLHVAMRILANDSYLTMVDYADQLLKYFVEEFSDLYGAEYVSYNVHGLVHLADDCRAYGALDSFSAFPFENKFQNLKNKLKKKDHPLEQLRNRLHEETIQPKVRKVANLPHYGAKLSVGPIEGGEHFKNITTDKFKLGVDESNSCIISKNNEIFEIESILKAQNGPQLICRKYQRTRDLYLHPCPSHAVGAYICESLQTTLHTLHLRDVAFKAVRLRIDRRDGALDHSCAVFSILHLNHNQH